MSETQSSKLRNRGFRFDPLKFEFVSDFDIRISDLRF
jgi:hypothetical protein